MRVDTWRPLSNVLFLGGELKRLLINYRNNCIEIYKRLIAEAP